MIVDSIENIGSHSVISEQITEFVNLYKDKFRSGKIIIDQESIFAIGLEYVTIEPSRLQWEAHRKYIDIHYVLDGEEFIHVSEIDSMSPISVYQDDFQFFEGVRQHEILMKPGNFIVLYPKEVHKTSVIYKKPANIKKIVFKVLTDIKN